MKEEKIKRLKDFIDEQWDDYRKKVDSWKKNCPEGAVCPYIQPSGLGALVKMLDYLAEEIEKLKNEKI